MFVDGHCQTAAEISSPITTEFKEEAAQMEKWVVAYAKISLDKDTGVALQGVYFGGLGETPDEAEKIARECVNSIKGGTIIPKVIRVTDQFNVIDALYEAADRFESTTKRMQDAEAVLNRGKKK